MEIESRYVNSLDLPPILGKYFLREERMLAHQRRLGIQDFRYSVVVNDSGSNIAPSEQMSYPDEVPMVWRLRNAELEVNIRNAGVNLNNRPQVANYLNSALRRRLDQLAVKRLVEGMWEIPSHATALLASFGPDYLAKGSFLNNGIADNVISFIIATHLQARFRKHDVLQDNPDVMFAQRSMLLPIAPNIEGIALSLLDRRRLITY